MRRAGSMLVVRFGTVVLALMCVLPPVSASVQDEGICWDPDIEFPTACDDDDE